VLEGLEDELDEDDAFGGKVGNDLLHKGVGILVLAHPGVELGIGNLELVTVVVNVNDDLWSNVKNFRESILSEFNLFVP
jgi:hypothetical protein